MKSISLIKIGGFFGILLGVLDILSIFFGFGLFIPLQMYLLYVSSRADYLTLNSVFYFLTGISWIIFALAIITCGKIYNSKISAVTGIIANICGLLAVETSILILWIIHEEDLFLLKKIIPCSIFVLFFYELFLLAFSIFSIMYSIKAGMQKLGLIGGILLLISMIPSMFMTLVMFNLLLSNGLFALVPYKLSSKLGIGGFALLILLVLYAFITLILQSAGLILCGVSVHRIKRKEKKVEIVIC